VFLIEVVSFDWNCPKYLRKSAMAGVRFHVNQSTEDWRNKQIAFGNAGRTTGV
jgi:hypothetical protein